MANDKKKESVGGLAFMFSLSCLCFLSIMNINALPGLFNEEGVWENWTQFGSGTALGAWFGHMFIRGRTHVFLHEFKHSLVSGLVGNRAKAIKVQQETGKFTYEYTKDTKKFNALISLAPYFLPIFTIPAIGLATACFEMLSAGYLIMIGVGYGIDCALNWRDISPIQSDFQNISGGFKVGVLFVVAMNVTIFTYLAAWVSQGWLGIKFLFTVLYNIMLHVVAYYRGL